MPLRHDPREVRGEARSFEADDARLNADLDRYERTRPQLGPAQYGHDENYRPGYHQGGTRFGFFGIGGDDGQGSLDAGDFDPDYLAWRQRQMARHDRDYDGWRRDQMRQYDDDYWRFRTERREDFHQRFQDWRAQREAERAAPPAEETKKA